MWTIPNAGNNTGVDSDVSPTTGYAAVTVVSGEEKQDVDAGVMDSGPYYPDWTNDVQVCTNDGFDPSWLQLQKINYLYKNKEECCKTHFWWRMNQCMANEEFKFYKVGEGDDAYCDTKIYFKDWEDNSPTEWTKTTQFDTLKECCANKFYYDYEGCVARSPTMFKFEFCVDVQGLVDPQDCQSADIYANVLEDAVNEGCYHTHGINGEHGDHGDEAPQRRKRRKLHDDEDWGDLTTVDANITKIGGVSLSKVDGSTVCGGSLGGQGFINELTGSQPDIEGADGSTTTVCGVITVEEDECKDEECLLEHFDAITVELMQFTMSGDLTLAINNRARNRLPPVPELQVVTATPFSMETLGLIMPETITGELNLQFYHGSDLDTCMEKSVFQSSETRYETLDQCCETHFSWGFEKCCRLGGGCLDSGIAGIPEDAEELPLRWFPTWTGKKCSSKRVFDAWETENYGSLAQCCNTHFTRSDENSLCFSEHGPQ